VCVCVWVEGYCRIGVGCLGICIAWVREGNRYWGPPPGGRDGGGG